MSSGIGNSVRVTFPSDPPPLLTLNSKVRVPIWFYLTELDKRRIRLVCRFFKYEIDTKVGLSVNLDERNFLSRNDHGALPPSVSKLRLWGSTFTSDYLTRLLLNSRLLTSVQFTGPIDLLNFKTVLTQCPNLSLVNITRKSCFQDGEQLPLKNKSVRQLRLGTKGHFSDYSWNFIQFPDETPWQTYFSVLSNLTFPCLRTFSFEFTVLTPGTYFPVLQCIFGFLASHRTIEHLMLRILKGSNYTEPSDCIKIAYKHLQLPGLDLVRLNLTRLIISTEPNAWLYWNIILIVQVNLVHFDCSADTKSWEYFVPIITQNCETLRVLKLRELNTSAEELRINLEGLAQCKSLEELLISRFGRTTQETGIPVRIPNPMTSAEEGCGKLPQLSGLNFLPVSLKRLAIQGLRVKTEDLALIPRNLKNLEILDLQLVGYKPQIPDHQFQVFVPLMRPSCRRNPVPVFRDISRHGLGVSPFLLQTLLTKCRKLKALFVEEFYNNRTQIDKCPDFNKRIRDINLIVGNNVLRSGGYFGVLVDASGREWCLRSFDTLTGMNMDDEEEKGGGEYLRAWDSRLKAYKLQNIGW